MLTVDEVARLMRVTPKTVRTWIRIGRLAAVKGPFKNSRVLVPASSLIGVLQVAGRRQTEEVT